MTNVESVSVLLYSATSLVTSVVALVKLFKVQKTTDDLHKSTDQLHEKTDKLSKDVNGRVDNLVAEARKTGSLEAIELSNEYIE